MVLDSSDRAQWLAFLDIDTEPRVSSNVDTLFFSTFFDLEHHFIMVQLEFGW